MTNNTTHHSQSMSFLINRNVTVQGHRTSVRLEPDMWAALFEIIAKEGITLHELCDKVAMERRPGTSFTASLRVFVMNYFRKRTGQDQPLPEIDSPMEPSEERAVQMVNNH